MENMMKWQLSIGLGGIGITIIIAVVEKWGRTALDWMIIHLSRTKICQLACEGIAHKAEVIQLREDLTKTQEALNHTDFRAQCESRNINNLKMEHHNLSQEHLAGQLTNAYGGQIRHAIICDNARLFLFTRYAKAFSKVSDKLYDSFFDFMKSLNDDLITRILTDDPEQYKTALEELKGQIDVFLNSQQNIQ